MVLKSPDKMLAFICAFDALTKRAKRWRSFEVRLWHHFGYWFHAMRRNFGTELRVAVKTVDQWQGHATTVEEGGTAPLIPRQKRQ